MRPSEQYETINRFRRLAPVDVEGLARALGVDVRYAYLSQDISGMLEQVRPDKYVITVNAAHHHNRKRFTIAHELGHFILHRKLVGKGVDDDRAYRSTERGKYHNTMIGPREETEANKFAADVLMPFDLIQQVAREERTLSAAVLARRFGVSEHAMEIRLDSMRQQPLPF